MIFFLKKKNNFSINLIRSGSAIRIRIEIFGWIRIKQMRIQNTVILYRYLFTVVKKRCVILFMHENGYGDTSILAYIPMKINNYFFRCQENRSHSFEGKKRKSNV